MGNLFSFLILAILGYAIYKLVRRARTSPQEPKKRFFEREGSRLWELWCDEWIIALPVTIFLWPLMLPYYLFKWSYKYIYVPLDDKRQMGRLRRDVANEKVKMKNELELVAQKLRDAAPKETPNNVGVGDGLAAEV